MIKKTNNPYPVYIRRLLKKFLPSNWYLKKFGRHEEESLRIWGKLASRLSPHEAVIDIGAFQGGYAIRARRANHFAQIYAFEPNPHSVAVLRKNCDGLDIHIEELAVSDHNGITLFSSSSAMSRIVNTNNTEDQDLLQVSAICLDQWTLENNIKVGLAKIDVEGAEAAVLRGAQRMLTTNQPFIICEVLSDDAGLLVSRTLPGNYLYYHIDENDGLHARTSVNRRLWRNKNWLFVPKDKLHILEDII